MTNEHLRAELKQTALPDGGLRNKVLVQLDAAAPKGRIHAVLKLKVRGRPQPGAEPVDKQYQLKVAADVFGLIQVQPNLFAVGAVLPDEDVRKVVRLRRVDGKPLSVVGAQLQQLSHAELQLKVEPFEDAEGPGRDLVVHGKMATQFGLIRGKVVVMTDAQGEEPLEFMVMGKLRKADGH